MLNLFKAVEIDDQEILEELMSSLIEIAKVNYDYMEEFIVQIGTFTT